MGLTRRLPPQRLRENVQVGGDDRGRAGVTAGRKGIDAGQTGKAGMI